MAAGDDTNSFAYLDTLADTIAETFLDAYYYALEKDRSTISTFYVPKTVAPDSTVPFIAWNGDVYDEGTDFQSFFETLTHTHYDVESLNVDILNVKALPVTAVKNGSGEELQDFDRRMSITIQAGGSVRLEKPLTGPIREFSDVIVLVPDPEKLPKGPVTEAMITKNWDKQWVIQSQNFRFTEWGATEVRKAQGGEVEMEVEKDEKTRARNRGIASQFAAAGLHLKEKAGK